VPKRPKPGDVVEIRVGERFAYGVFLGKHSLLGDSMWLIRGVFDEQKGVEIASNQPDGFIVFYSVSASVRDGRLQMIGHYSGAIPPVPVLVRLRANVSPAGKTLQWNISDGVSQNFGRSDLSTAERALPIGSIWNYLSLVHNIETGWSPESAD
jgi:hypothetical protein